MNLMALRKPILRSLSIVWSIIIGIIGIVQFVAWLQPAPEHAFLYEAVDTVVSTRAENFHLTTRVGSIGEVAENEDLTETLVTIWRESGEPVTSEMTRRPLTLMLPSGAQLLAFRVVNEANSEAARFEVTQDGSNISLRWKVFDPTTAIQIALIRAGSRDPLYITRDLGPNIQIIHSLPWTKSAFLGSFAVATVLLFIALMATSCFKFIFPTLDKLSAWIRPTFLQFAVWIIGFALMIAVLTYAALALQKVTFNVAKSIQAFPFEKGSSLIKKDK